MILSPCSAGRVLSRKTELCHLAFNPGTNKSQLLYLMAQNSVLNTLFLHLMQDRDDEGMPTERRADRRDFLKVAVFLQTRSTAPPHTYRVRNDPLPSPLHQTPPMPPPSEDTGSLSLKPTATNPLHIALWHCHNHSLLKSSCRTA